MIFTPKPYQPPVQRWLLDAPRGALWAEMGLGKTATVLNVLSTLRLVDELPALIIGPARVARSVWHTEAAKWDHLKDFKVQPLVGTAQQREEAMRISADAYTISYESLPWLITTLGDRWPFKTIVADEATRLKGFRVHQGGKRANILGRRAWKSTRFIELSGTPSPNGLRDLWGQMWFLDGGHRLGRTHQSFLDRWFYALPSGDGYSKLAPHKHAHDEISAAISDITLSVRTEDHLDIRKPKITPVWVDLPPAARALYKQMEKKLYLEIEGHAVEAFNAGAKSMKCMQLANGAVYVDDKGAWKAVHNAKIEALDSIVNELNGAPLIVGYTFQSDLARILKAFPQAQQLRTTKDEDRWNEGRIPIAVMHPKSGGHGLNLQHGGHHMALFGNDWNLEEYLQLIERIGPARQLQSGYDRVVTVWPILARKTVDEAILLRREGKITVQNALMRARAHAS